MFFELVVICLGVVLNIDVFNQPGVDAPKQRIKEIIAKRENND